jgi:iron-sulfur cluster repair protein YtfE (RIC family)
MKGDKMLGNLDMLKKQHSEVLTMMKNIDTLMIAGPKERANEIAFNINALSGKLKMHLMSEDKFLYPMLMQNSCKEVRNTANEFNREMGGLAELFSAFVQQYNTSFKILQRMDSFLTDSKKIFSLIEERIRREDGKLYSLAEA